MKNPLTFEERVALWVLLVALVLLFFAFTAAYLQGAEVSPPTLPKALPKVTRIYPTYYFSATAYDPIDKLESDYCKELRLVTTNLVNSVTLAWDYDNTNKYVFFVYFGAASGIYTNRIEAGTNLSCVVFLRPPRKTNTVITITSTNATNLAYSSNMKNWATLNCTNKTYTNLPYPLYFRSVGTNSKVNIQKYNY